MIRRPTPTRAAAKLRHILDDIALLEQRMTIGSATPKRLCYYPDEVLVSIRAAQISLRDARQVCLMLALPRKPKTPQSA